MRSRHPHLFAKHQRLDENLLQDWIDGDIAFLANIRRDLDNGADRHTLDVDRFRGEIGFHGLRPLMGFEVDMHTPLFDGMLTNSQFFFVKRKNFSAIYLGHY